MRLETDGLYQKIFQESPIASFVFNRKGEVLFVTKSFYTLLPRKRAKIISDLMVNFFPPCNLLEIFSKDLKLQKKIITYSQFQVKEQSFQLIVCQLQRHLAQVFFIPVIGKQELISELTHCEERFQQITETITDIFFLLDLKTRHLLYVSPSFETIWGGSSKHLIKNPAFWVKRIHPEDKDKFESLYAEQIKTGIMNACFRIIQLNSRQRWIHVRTFPIYDQNGRPYRSSGIIEDITQQVLLEEEKINSLKNLHQSYNDLIISLVKAQESKDPYTTGHQNNVAVVSVAISKKLNLSDDTIKGIELAAHVHDIGKIGIPAELLTKPVQLTSLEFELIKTHPEIGFNILKSISFPWPIAETVLQHHERINGSGYPNKLSGENIRKEAKIIAVADSLDAMVSHRPYRLARTIEFALAELLKYQDILYDAEVVNACVHLFNSNELNLYKNIQR